MTVRRTPEARFTTGRCVALAHRVADEEEAVAAQADDKTHSDPPVVEKDGREPAWRRDPVSGRLGADWARFLRRAVEAGHV